MYFRWGGSALDIRKCFISRWRIESGHLPRLCSRALTVAGKYNEFAHIDFLGQDATLPNVCALLTLNCKC